MNSKETATFLLFWVGMASVSSLTWAEGVTNFGSHTPTQEEFTRALTLENPENRRVQIINLGF